MESETKPMTVAETYAAACDSVIVSSGLVEFETAQAEAGLDEIFGAVCFDLIEKGIFR